MCTAGLPHRVSPGEANIVIIVNLFMPGVGTIIAGCIGTHGGKAILIGLLQMVLFPALLIGWVWALIWGLALRKQAKHANRETREGDVEHGKSGSTSGKGHSHSHKSSHHHHSHEKVTEPAPVHHEYVQHGSPAHGDVPPPPNQYDTHLPPVPPAPPSAPPLY